MSLTSKQFDVLLTPAEFAALAKRDLRETVCVVFDVLRATSTFVTALHNGAKEIIPVSEISEALAIKNSEFILRGGERNGVRISANGIDFDLGNSPREYSPEKVRGKTIVSTTTNGTRALRACANAKIILAASFLNLTATAEFLRQDNSTDILLVCAGTRENAALEDTLAAGALCELLVGASRCDDRTAQRAVATQISTSAEIALQTYTRAKSDLAATVIRDSENARRLLAIPELCDDVAFCLQRDIYPLIARMEAGGAIRRA
ncbi:MAG TPA: 2-phosphosulfolactate phosphatase [Candidatus Baltobacteraceae bacterium]|nr:2-phosphosulfolactate phosphatase [Candidatus Baltobacteraceae bacterium]